MVIPGQLPAEEATQPPHRRPTRRRANRVHEPVACALAALGGAAAAASPASPTGLRATDAVVVGLAVAVVCYAGASAPWWLLVVASLGAVVVSGSVVLVGVAAIAGIAALFVGWRRRDLSTVRCASAAVIMNVLARADADLSFGATAAVAVLVGAIIVVAGLRRRPRSIRRMARRGVYAVGLLAVLATGAFLLEAMAARSALTDGKREAQAAIDAVERGDYDAATAHFRQASVLLGDASERLDRPWVWPAAFVPGVAQHRRLAVDLARDGEDALSAAAGAVAKVDPDALRVQAGVVDLAAIEALSEPIGTLDASLDQLANSIETNDSRWLLAPMRRELAELTRQLDDNEGRLDNVVTAVDLAPRMLGGDGRRVYLVLFTTPAEARGFGGFVGNFAELTIDDGDITMSEFGRVSDLEALSRALGVRISGPADFLSRYGTFGYNTDGDGLVGSAPWRNLTISPDFPAIAEVAAEMYPQITGRPIDGVIAVDPYVIATLLGYTGPVELSTVDVTIDSANAAQYILLDQYQLAEADNTERIDALEEIARRTVERLLEGAMPGPDILARDLGPLARARRVSVWTADRAEQDLLRRIGLLGEIPELDGADGWSVAVTNGAGNKIDTFLQRTFDYESTTADGVTTATLRATLANTAPESGLPYYVIGNVIGMPDGTSRAYVSFYSALELQSATLNGSAVELAASEEAGWNVYSGFVTIPSAEQVVYELALAGMVAEPDRIVTWEQPLVLPAVVESQPAPPADD